MVRVHVNVNIGTAANLTYWLISSDDESESHDSRGYQDTLFTLSIKSEDEVLNHRKVFLSVNFTLNPDYPVSVPEISVNCNLSRDKSMRIKHDVTEYAKTLAGQPMLMDLAMWLQQNAVNYAELDTQQSIESNTEGTRDLTVLLHLDHMRAKAKYIKTITRWTEELKLHGRLLFFNRLILILLQGTKDNIKEYITRQRTVNVDVDSKGKSCKERMLSVLHEEPIKEGQERFSDFGVTECGTKTELEAQFIMVQLEYLFKGYVYDLLR